MILAQGSAWNLGRFIHVLKTSKSELKDLFQTFVFLDIGKT